MSEIRTAHTPQTVDDNRPAERDLASSRRRILSASLVAVLSMAFLCLPSPPAMAANSDAGCQERWIGSWMAAKPVNSMQPSVGSDTPRSFVDQTLRMIIGPHYDGGSLRLTLSNRYGSTPVTFDSVYVGMQASGADIVAGTNRSLAFGGKASVTVPVGSVVTSDELAFDVKAFRHLAVSFHVVGGPIVLDEHPEPSQESYLTSSGSGNVAAATSGSGFSAVPALYALEELDVRAAGQVGTVVTLGDSITDGTGSTWGTDNRYPDLLQRTLQARGNGKKFSVLNAGLGANAASVDSILTGPSGASRFSRDVASRPGVTDVVLLEGINDIGLYGSSADQITAALASIASQAHADGYTIKAGTLLPFEGAFYYSSAGESTRQAVNAWIRSAGVFDHVVDFARAMQDPANPRQINPAYDSGDHLHPNDAGYAHMASNIDPSTFHTTC